MLYTLKRKNETVTVVDFAEDGSVNKFQQKLAAPELAPMHNQNDTAWLKTWWRRRSVPISQGHIRAMLERKGLLGSEDFLLKNLGLSLTDYYWIAPVNSDLTWEDVNLFENDFYENILTGGGEDAGTPPHYTPNGSLQGSLEKSWVIMNGERGLLKGNRDQYSAESINEVIATELHKRQGAQPFAEYRLVKIAGREYDYGCFSPLFTSLHKELVSAYDVVTSEKKPNDISYYEHFLNVCGKHGIDTDALRQYMDYLIMSDFVLSNRDRHLSNISVLRNAETLLFIGPAPIFDTGKSLFVHELVPNNERSLLEIKCESFAGTELGMLKLVCDRGCLDTTKLPSRSFVEDMYALDSQADSHRIKAIGEGYERKIGLLRAFQLGEDLGKRVIPIRKKQ